MLLTASTWLGFQILHPLSILTLLGLPELAPDKCSQQLVTTGIYATIRHPRYVQIYLGFLGSALIANYLALYLIVALWLPGIYVIVFLEERECENVSGWLMTTTAAGAPVCSQI